MSMINFSTREISVKIVYYGPALCGKTTSIRALYDSIPKEKRPDLVSIATEGDRTMFFDFLPMKRYRVHEFTLRLQLYTVPGQVFYNSTRKLVLSGADAVVFVADSQREMRHSNTESLQNLEENLTELGIKFAELPLVIQANKRDLPNIDSVEEMQELYNPRGVEFFATTATKGVGVEEALHAVATATMAHLNTQGLSRQLEAGPQRPLTGWGRTQDASSLMQAARALGAPKPPLPVAASSPSLQSASNPLELWPDGPVRELGMTIEAAMAEKRWVDVLSAVQTLLTHVALNDADAIESHDSVPVYLLKRGSGGRRYVEFLSHLSAAEAGKEPSREVAFAAWVLALEAVW